MEPLDPVDAGGLTFEPVAAVLEEVGLVELVELDDEDEALLELLALAEGDEVMFEAVVAVGLELGLPLILGIGAEVELAGMLGIPMEKLGVGELGGIDGIPILNATLVVWTGILLGISESALLKRLSLMITNDPKPTITIRLATMRRR